MKVYVAGHGGMVGSAVYRLLAKSEDITLVGRSSRELNLLDQSAVKSFIEHEKPDSVVVAAARVGGILANDSYPYQFLMENLQIQENLLTSAVEQNIEKLVFLGSSCIYPKLAPQPMKEEHLLTGPLESTNQWYAIAKIAGVKACEAVRKQYSLDYISLMPTNLYGPNDNFDYQTSHVLPAMIRKFHDAKLAGHLPVTLWGSGTPLREFLHVDDLAKAVEFALRNEMKDSLYNVGSGEELSIKNLAKSIQKQVGHEGEIVWDSNKPDGTPRKLMDSNKFMAHGWQPTIGLDEGISNTYSWFLENQDNFREVKVN